MEIRELGANWMIARDAGLWLVGLQKEGLAVLAPVFELGIHVVPTQAGIQVTYHARPLLLCPSMAESWDLSASSQWWPLKGSTVETQVRAAVNDAEAQLLAMRMAASGLVPPGAPGLGGRT